MKKLLLLILTSLSLTASENLYVTKIELLSNFDVLWHIQLFYSYDSSGRIVESISKNIVFDTSYYLDRIFYVYNNSGSVIEDMHQIWLPGLNDWFNRYRFLHIYDSNNELIERRIEHWENDNWVNYQIETYTTLSDELKIKVVQNWIDNSWVNDYKYTYNYRNNILISIIYYGWFDSTDSTWSNSSKLEYEYENNKMSSETYSLWVNSKWDYQSKKTYSYDQNGNLFSFGYLSWNTDHWQNSSRISYDYDTNNLLKNYIIELFNQDGWKNNRKVQYFYNFKNLIDTIYKSNWISNNWYLVSLESYSYNDSDYLTKWFSKSYYSDDGADEDFTFHFPNGDTVRVRCYSLTAEYSPFSPVDENNPSHNFNINIYPNPAQDFLNISLDGINNLPSELSLSDILGRKQFDFNNPGLSSGKTGNSHYRFDVRNLNPGIYLLEYQSGKQKATKKIIIE